MAANALNKMRHAISQKQSADEFEYVEVPRHLCPLRYVTVHAHEPQHVRGGGLQQFIDLGFARCNALQTFVLP